MINAVKRAITNLSEQEKHDCCEKKKKGKQVQCDRSVMSAAFKTHPMV